MTPERARRIEELYAKALEYPPEERAAFLVKACGRDEDLRREVESLITGGSPDGSFMEAPAFDVVSRNRAAQSQSWAGASVITSLANRLGPEGWDGCTRRPTLVSGER